MQNSFLTEVQLLALDTLVSHIPNQCLHDLSSSARKTRLHAYAEIQQILGEKMGEDSETREALPIFFAETGDTLSALGYLLTTLEAGGSAPKDRVVSVIRKSCDNYKQIFDKVASLRGGNDDTVESPEDIAASEDILRQTHGKISELLGSAGLVGALYYRAKAEYAHKVEHKREEAIMYYEKMLREADHEELAEDFLTLGNLYREVGDMPKALDSYSYGFRATRDIALFEHAVRSGITVEGETLAQASFEKSKPEGYRLPFSSLRGYIRDEDELVDIEEVIGVLFDGGDSDIWQSAYLRSISDFLESRTMLLRDLFQKWEDEDTGEDRYTSRETRNIASREYLELLEYQIFYLLEWKNLKEYLQLIEGQLTSKEGISFISEYFSDHPLASLAAHLIDEDAYSESQEGLEAEPKPDLSRFYDIALASFESTPGEEEISEDDDTTSDEVPVSSRFSLPSGTRDEILKRYTYLVLRISTHDLSRVQIQGSERDIASAQREELMLISDHIKTLFPEADFWRESFVLEKKVQREERRLEHAGPEAHQDYHDIIEEIDTKYSITERRFLAYHARSDLYTKDRLPAMCQKDSLLAMFFISERLLAGYDAQFDEHLHSIIKNYRLHTLPDIHILTFAEILKSSGFSTEAFVFLAYTDTMLADPDGILILTEIISGMDPDSHEYRECMGLLDERAIRGYGKDGFENVLLEGYEFQRGGLAELSESDNEDDIASQKKGLAIMAYALGVFLIESSPEEAERYKSEAIGLGLSEAHYSRALADLVTPGSDHKNILDGFLLAFPDTEYPVRGYMLTEIAPLAIELGERDIVEKYQNIARIEGVVVGLGNLSRMLEDEERRYILYTFLRSPDQSLELAEDDLRILQSAINTDLRSAFTPLDIKIVISHIKARIASHEKYGTLPASLEHWDCIRENFGEIQAPEFRESYVSLVQEIFPEFDPTTRKGLTFVNALNFHAIHFRSKFIEYLHFAEDDEDKRAGLHFYTIFIDAIVDILSRLPESGNLEMKVKDENRMILMSALDYWTQEQMKNNTLIYNLQNPENLVRNFTPYTHNPVYISHFPTHATIQ